MIVKVNIKHFADFVKKCFSIAHGGRNYVTQHARGANYKKNRVAMVSLASISNFFIVKNSTEYQKVALSELIKVFHCVKHNQAYNALDCGNKLFHYIFDDSKIATKVACGRAKAEAIVKGVLAPHVVNKVIGQLKGVNYFSISTDTSNKGNRKFHPICVQNFSVNEGVVSKLIDFIEEPHESAESIAKYVKDTLKKHGLSINYMSAYCADNTNANFEKKTFSICLLKEKNNKLIKLFCPTHIVNNAFKHALDTLDVDVESIVLKVYLHFSNSAVRREELRNITEFVEEEWHELLKHVTTRWLTLGPAVDRLIECWTALMSYFISAGTAVLKALRKLLNINDCDSDVSEHKFDDVKIVLHFVGHISKCFEVASKKLQMQNSTAIDAYEVMHILCEQLSNRISDEFFGSFVCDAFIEITPEKKRRITNNFLEFIQTALNYLQQWFDFSDENPVSSMECLSLKKQESFDKYNNLVKKLKLETCINIDKLYDEYSIIKSTMLYFVSSKSSMNLSEKWSKIFQSVEENFLKLVSFCLSIPGSNAFVEKCFPI